MAEEKIARLESRHPPAGWFATEDGWAVWIGLAIVVLSLGTVAGADVLGWAVATQVWGTVSKAIAPVSPAYAALAGFAGVLCTYAFTLALMAVGARALRYDRLRFVAGFSVVVFVAYACWLLGHYAYIAATPDTRATFGIGWSLGLTGEAGFLIALSAGLAIGNFFPRVAAALKEATRPEWFIKTAIVILGASLGVCRSSS